jgi:(p)ppGpp synthase/HD superfamily hydrolase
MTIYEAAMKISNPILRAAFLARVGHDKQLRKVTKRPYFTHPARVAGRIMGHPECDEALACAAYCHDLDEDTWIKIPLIREILGDDVATLVEEVTNPSKAFPEEPRRVRKQMDLEHSMEVSRRGKLLKLHDRLDNLGELGTTPPHDFCKLYAKESIRLIEAIGDVDPELMKEALDLAHTMLKLE